MDISVLLASLQFYSTFDEKDFPAFVQLFDRFYLKKGEYFYKAGQVPTHSPFIVKGCMRKFFINEEGDEQIVFFAEEGWFAGELHCMRGGIPTNMNLQALEDCEILAITLPNVEIGFMQFPEYRRFVDHKYAADHNRIIEEATRLKSDTPESLYLRLLRNRPSIILRVPSYHIANYLGITKETLSRVRKKIATP